MTSSGITVFGYGAGGTSSALRSRFAQFSELLAKKSKLEISLFESSSYEELATAVVSGYVDVAWLPPIPYIALERHGAVAPLVQLHRGGRSTFHSVLVVRADSRFHAPNDLVRARAAWVDRYSASGFVVPRVALANLGVDPRSAFSEQRFWRSHESAIRVVVGGRADFAATYAGVGPDGAIERGPWLDVKGAADAVRVIAVLGEIPGDIVAVHAGLDPAKRQCLTTALLAISHDKRSRLLANDAFGVDEFQPFEAAGYIELRQLTESASDAGLLDVAEAADQTGLHVAAR